MSGGVAERVRAAADYIEEHGLNKGWFHELLPDGPRRVGPTAAAIQQGLRCCTIGALVGHGYEDISEFWSWLRERDPQAAAGGIPRWNDDPNTTAEEVVLRLRQYASHLDDQVWLEHLRTGLHHHWLADAA